MAKVFRGRAWPEQTGGVPGLPESGRKVLAVDRVKEKRVRPGQ